ncbi:hypothetical protein A7U60_g1325 [Sanghuangporus baumii]|uniref:Integrase catalytic domain-containing protein n=1 Tax=Sanghuangporus baumii TaxID=108892 RepID=A0A9Q5I495_SANBA|nr:hypothetical protein A7U60_g1325 [Sanghuangporus baumii]
MGKVEWKWGEEEQAAFKELKCHLSSPPVLAIPNNEDPFHVEVDASDFATGGVLLQKQDGKWKVIIYWSSTFLEAERNYEIYNKEMLAIIQVLKKWQQYLQGANKPFEAHWQLDLSEFDFTLVHKPGKTLGKADLLLRHADYDKGERDNENVMFIKKEWLVRGTVQTSRDVLIKNIMEAQRREEEGERPKDVKKQGDTWRKGRRLTPRSDEDDSINSTKVLVARDEWRRIIHDRGVQFNAKMMRKLYKLLHIEGNPSTVYHPQTDGQTERVNQELEQYLRLYINHR